MYLIIEVYYQVYSSMNITSNLDRFLEGAAMIKSKCVQLLQKLFNHLSIFLLVYETKEAVTLLVRAITPFRTAALGRSFRLTTVTVTVLVGWIFNLIKTNLNDLIWIPLV